MSGLNALVVEGGAMRGVFSAGVLDSFLTHDFNPFDTSIGVSAGATNIAAYLAGMFRRNYRIYTEYSLRREFINPVRFFLGGHLMDLDWLWDITIREVRLDLPRIFSREREFYIGVAEVETGKVRYLKPTPENLEELLKASSSIPPFYRAFINLEGTDVTDGGVADPLPVREAVSRGARNLMVIRSRPYAYEKKSSSEALISRMYLKQHPALIEAMEKRADVYRESIAFLRNPPDGIRILEVNPPDTFRTGRLTRDRAILEEGYACGFDMGETVIRNWNTMIAARGASVGTGG